MARGENQESQTGNVPAASASAAGPKPAAEGPGKGAEGQSVVRRLQSELMALMMGGDPGVSAFPEGDNIFHWVGTIAGSAGTAYEGTSYRLALAFTAEYPYKPPKVPTQSLQAAQGAVRHAVLPPQRRRARQHLPRHPPGQVVLGLRRPHHPALHPEPPRRAEQRLAAQHAGGGALGEPGRVQKDGGEALQGRRVEEGGPRKTSGADAAASRAGGVAWRSSASSDLASMIRG